MRQLNPNNLTLPPDCGGKANGLARLARWGLRVPDTVFIPASMADPLSEPAIAQCIESLGWPLIVRSSATEEDGQRNAFAGLLESIHDITSTKELVAAIKTCRQSGGNERVKIYCQKRGIRFPLRVGVVIQPEASPDLAGVLFTRDPIFPNHKVAYVEWVSGHGRHLVGGEALDGRAWLDTKGQILRTDFLTDITVDFLAEIANALVDLEPNDNCWDLEFFVKDSQLWWVQHRPATAQPAPKGQATPAVLPWELPGLPDPIRQKTAKEKGLFEGWDEYNETTVSPLHYDGFYRTLWEACLDSICPPHSLLPTATNFVRCKQTVPIAIDAGNSTTSRKPQYCEATNLRQLLGKTTVQVSQLQQKLPQLQTAKESYSALLAVFKLYANLTSVRLKAMWSWIEGIEHCTNAIGRLLEKSGLKEIDPDALVDEILAAVDHETKRMRSGLKKLAVSQHDYQQAKQDFLVNFGHFQVEGVPYVLCPDKVLKGLAADPQTEATGPSTDLLAKTLDQLDPKDKDEFEQAVTELEGWFELRESSKTQQEIPYPLILNLESQLAKQLEQMEAIPIGSLELHSLSELETTINTGKSPLRPTVVADRRSILQWKQTAPWIPAWYSGETTMDQLSPGVATGPARIVRDLKGFARVCPGDILVARTTNPAWTPLFAKIAGLIVEHGSRISHAAIVAREYEVPAVAGFISATQQLVDGELVEVDGNNGTVKRLNTVG